MERDDHIKNLHDKLNSNSVIKDFDSLWDELEPRLPKKKKRRYLFILLIPVLLLLGLSILTLNTISKESDSKELLSEISIVNTKSDKEEIRSQSQYSDNFKNLESGQSVSPKQKEIIANELPSIKLGKSKQGQRKQLRVSNQLGTNNQASLLNQTQTNISKNRSGIGSNESSLNANATFLNPSDKLKLNDESLNNNRDPKNMIASDINVSSNQNELSHKSLNQESIDLISFQKLNNRSISLLEFDRSILSRQPQLFESNDNVKTKWSIAFGTHFLTDFNQKSQNNISDYGQTIDDLTSVKGGYSYGVHLSLTHHTGFLFGLRIEKAKTFEKFRVNNVLSSTETSINDQAFVLNGEFISSEAETIKTLRQDVLVYNSYIQTNVSPFIGYEKAGNISYSFTASPILNMNRNYKGYLIDNLDQITTDIGQMYESSKLSYNGFTLSAVASKSLWKGIDLGIKTQFRKSNNVTAESNADYQIGLKSYSIGLELRYVFD